MGLLFRLPCYWFEGGGKVIYVARDRMVPPPAPLSTLGLPASRPFFALCYVAELDCAPPHMTKPQFSILTLHIYFLHHVYPHPDTDQSPTGMTSVPPSGNGH